uniref:Thrombospondin-like N-terminal domain-containing protein n=2 Tax=Callorhinchus milii TaxID=7868 RepID=A0A4W3IJ07_CALMI
MNGSTKDKNWNIWQIKDPLGNDQVGVRMNGGSRSVEFFAVGVDGALQTITFSPVSTLYDSQWHKVLISVQADTVTLFIDCERLETQRINPRGIINTKGDTFLGKLSDNPTVSVPFDVQWMIIHCDPYRAQRESCPELSIG